MHCSIVCVCRWKICIHIVLYLLKIAIHWAKPVRVNMGYRFNMRFIQIRFMICVCVHVFVFCLLEREKERTNWVETDEKVAHVSKNNSSNERRYEARRIIYLPGCDSACALLSRSVCIRLFFPSYCAWITSQSDFIAVDNVYCGWPHFIFYYWLVTKKNR